jgi:hypothetical protein
VSRTCSRRTNARTAFSKDRRRLSSS